MMLLNLVLEILRLELVMLKMVMLEVERELKKGPMMML